MASTSNNDADYQSHFVEDGPERLAKGVRSTVYPAIEAAVSAEYSSRLAAAGYLRRIWLRWRMKREIERRVEQETVSNAPSEHALY
jgi:hypothetical protein